MYSRECIASLGFVMNQVSSTKFDGMKCSLPATSSQPTSPHSDFLSFSLLLEHNIFCPNGPVNGVSQRFHVGFA
jgi:hypothetical protein